MTNRTPMERHALRQASILEMDRLRECSIAELDEHKLKRLESALFHAANNSPHYRARFAQAGISPHVESLTDIQRFPFTTKEDLRNGYPFGLLAVPSEQLIRYGESTGTTGAPTSAFMTYADWERGNVWVERALATAFSATDSVFIAIPYELAFAAYDVDRALEALGATIVAVGTLNQICPWERILEMMRQLHPTGLVCTPTRALRLYDMFLERGLDPREVGLRVLFYIGETCSDAKLAKIAELWGVELYTAYGTTETNALGLICSSQQLHLAEDRYLFELLTPGGDTPVPTGERGELVLTSLASEAMPLIRYRTGDIVSIDSTPCSCGLPHRVMKHWGRYAERLDWDGRAVLRIDIEHAALSVPGTGAYYVLDDESNPPVMYVEVTGTDVGKVLREVETQVNAKCGVPIVAREVDKSLITRSMDRMLKPGSLSMRQVRALKAEETA